MYHLRDLNYETAEELVITFTLIPPGVIYLNLAGNNLGEKTGNELAIAFLGIPTSVTCLNLCVNNLGGNAQLATVFAAIPQSIKLLSLSHNNLHNQSSHDLATAFKTISTNVTELDLSCNELNKFSLNDIEQLKDSLPYLQTVYLSHEEVKQMSSEQYDALKAMFPRIENVILLDPDGSIDFDIQAELARKLGGKTELSSPVKPNIFQEPN